MWYYRHSLKPVTMLLLSQPRMLLAIPAARAPCWLSSVCAQQDHRPSSAELFPRQTGTILQSVLWPAALLSLPQHLAFFAAEFPSPLSHSYSLSRAVCVTALPSRVSSVFPRLCPLPVWSECAPVPTARSIARSLMTLHRTSPGWTPEQFQWLATSEYDPCATLR